MFCPLHQPVAQGCQLDGRLLPQILDEPPIRFELARVLSDQTLKHLALMSQAVPKLHRLQGICGEFVLECVTYFWIRLASRELCLDLSWEACTTRKCQKGD